MVMDCRATKPLSSFCDNPSMGNSIIMSTSTADKPEFILLNTSNGVELRRVNAPAMVTHIKPSYNLLVSGASDGCVRTHDFRTASRKDEGSTQNSAVAHAGGIQDLEVSGNYIYTCGWGYG